MAEEEGATMETEEVVVEKEEEKKEEVKPKAAPAPTKSPQEIKYEEAQAKYKGVEDEIESTKALKEQLLQQIAECDAKVVELEEQLAAVKKEVNNAKDDVRRMKFKGGGAKFASKMNTMGAVKCPLCDKRVYQTERALDSKDTVYHKKCLRCNVCHKAFNGKEPVDDDNIKKILPNQYRVQIVEDTTTLLCNLHGEIHVGEIAKKETAEDIAKKKAAEMSTMTRQTLVARKKEAAQHLELSMGETPLDFEEGKRLPVRSFVKRAGERLIVTMETTKEKPQPLTYMLDLDAETKTAALLKKKYDPARVTYHPDPEARVAKMRGLKQYDAANPLFVLAVRDGKQFTPVHPNGEEWIPQKGVKLEGVNFLKNRAAYMQLLYDGRIKYGAHKGKLGKEIVLDPSYTFEVTGDQGTLLEIKNGEKKIETIKFQHVDDTEEWKEAIEAVLQPEEDEAFAKAQKLSVYMYAEERGVLQTLEVIFALDESKPELGVVGANIRCSAWPRITPEEELDPLSKLKGDLTHKRRVEEVGIEKAEKIKKKEEKQKVKDDAKKAKEKQKMEKSQAALEKKAEKVKKKKGKKKK